MMKSEPGNTFRGLPWDTPELHAMLTDMLDPSEADEEGRRSIAGSMNKERSAAGFDDDIDHDETTNH